MFHFHSAQIDYNKGFINTISHLNRLFGDFKVGVVLLGQSSQHRYIFNRGQDNTNISVRAKYAGCFGKAIAVTLVNQKL